MLVKYQLLNHLQMNISSIRLFIFILHFKYVLYLVRQLQMSRHYTFITFCTICKQDHPSNIKCMVLPCLVCQSQHSFEELQSNICPKLIEITNQLRKQTELQCSGCLGAGVYQKTTSVSYYRPQNLPLLKTFPENDDSNDSQLVYYTNQVSENKMCNKCKGKGRISRFQDCCKYGCKNCRFQGMNENKWWKFQKKRSKITPVINQVVQDCPICFKTIELSQMLYKMECSHKFHRVCLFQWFKSKSQCSCPLCREQDPYFPLQLLQETKIQEGERERDSPQNTVEDLFHFVSADFGQISYSQNSQ